MKYWAELGGNKLTDIQNANFQITKILNGITSFEYTIQNNASNRAILATHLTEDFVIKSRYGGSWFPLKFPVTFGGRILLTGSIDSNNVEYLSKHRIRLTGYASFVDLSYQIFKRLAAADAADADDITYWDTGLNGDIFEIGEEETFSVIKFVYTTKGTQAANTTVAIEYYNGSAWVTLDTSDKVTFIDESRAFTKDVNTYFLIISNKPDGWAKESGYYKIRFRIAAGSYTVLPVFSEIKIGDVDVCRVQFDNVAADTVLGYVLEDTGYTEDATDQCPSDLISMRGEYDSKLRWIAAIAKSLTWGSSGEEKPYDWWIDTNKKVHFKQQRGDTADISHIFPLTFPILFGGSGYIDSELTMLNKRESYQGIANRIFGLGSFDGMNQRRAIVEDTASQDSYDLREIYLKDMRFSHEASLKELIQKELTDSKAPLREVSCKITSEYWIEHNFEVGDEVVIHQPSWNVSNQLYRIMRAVIGPLRARLDLGVSQMHLENIRSALQRQVDIDDVWMAGATNIYQVGPLLDNFERVDNTTVYPLTLNIYIPEEAKYINKVKLNWKLDKFRAPAKVTANSGAHTHGFSGQTTVGGGEHSHGFGGAETTQAADTEYVTGALMTATEHKHYSIREHYHAIPAHKHTIPFVDGDDDWNVGIKGATHGFRIQTGGGSGDFASTNDKAIFYTGAAIISIPAGDYAIDGYLPTSVTMGYNLTKQTHIHKLEGATTVTETNHTHSLDGAVTIEHSGHTHSISYGMQEDTDTSPIMELKVNGTTISDNYSGNQHDISITDHVSSGWNTIILQPKTGEDKRGRAQLDGIVQVFIESK